MIEIEPLAERSRRVVRLRELVGREGADDGGRSSGRRAVSSGRCARPDTRRGRIDARSVARLGQLGVGCVGPGFGAFSTGVSLEGVQERARLDRSERDDEGENCGPRTDHGHLPSGYVLRDLRTTNRTRNVRARAARRCLRGSLASGSRSPRELGPPELPPEPHARRRRPLLRRRGLGRACEARSLSP